MAVVVAMRGRLGNNLFQYAVGRIIAEQHGFALACHTRPLGRTEYLLNIPSARLTELSAYFPGAPLSLPGMVSTAPIACYDIDHRPGWDGQVFPLAAELQDCRPRLIQLGGFFQRYEYFAPFRARLREWFTPRYHGALTRVDPRDIVVNIRRGNDFLKLGWILPLSYYRSILSSVASVGRIHICGTGVDAQVRLFFREYSPVYHAGPPLADFCLMRGCRRIILSNSTFAWWAAYLSDATHIFGPSAPLGNGFAFSGFDGVSLEMERARYQSVAVTCFEKAELA